MTSMIAAQLIAPYLLGPQQPITGITQLEAYALPSSRACLPCKEAHIDSLPIDMHHLAWAVGGAVSRHPQLEPAGCEVDGRLGLLAIAVVLDTQWIPEVACLQDARLRLMAVEQDEPEAIGT